MCGALAIRPPSASKTAQEKSSRSLMLTEWEVDWRRTPICSATDMNRLLKISSRTGSASVPMSFWSARGVTRSRSRSPRSVTTARQPGSTTVVASSSVMIAGPVMACPGSSLPRSVKSTSVQAPPVNRGTRAAGSGLFSSERGWLSVLASASRWLPATSTDTASTSTGLSRMRKEKRREYSASKALVISVSDPTGTMTAVSVPW